MSKEINELKSHLDTMIGNSSQLKAEKLVKLGYRRQSEGEWIITDIKYLEITRECSNCHSKTYFPYNPMMHCRKPQYCEYCGAKMKGGAE